MCELFCISSRLPTRATFSLREFASHGAPGAIPVDGWGIALYDRSDVRLYKEPEPAGDSAWLSFVEKHHRTSCLLLSHIRHAVTGELSLAKTQPFVRELGGRQHVFAHNGQLNAIADRFRTKPVRFRPIGSTDSEHAFCLLLERLAPLWAGATVPALSRRLDVVARFADDMRELGPANFLYADSETLFAHSHRRMQADRTIAPPGLWILQRQCLVDPDGLPQAGVTIEAKDEGQTIVLLASVPLSDDGWKPLVEGEVIVVENGRVVVSRRPPEIRAASEQPVAGTATAV